MNSLVEGADADGVDGTNADAEVTAKASWIAINWIFIFEFVSL
jgi:hypothetical protein